MIGDSSSCTLTYTSLVSALAILVAQCNWRECIAIQCSNMLFTLIAMVHIYFYDNNYLHNWGECCWLVTIHTSEITKLTKFKMFSL